MPTKRTRVARNLVTPLTADWIDFLLEGKTHAAGKFDDPPGYDHFLEFDPHPPAEIRNLWEQHREVLLAEWRRRGGRGLPWCAKVKL
jgi:hypothetical protein